MGVLFGWTRNNAAWDAETFLPFFVETQKGRRNTRYPRSLLAAWHTCKKVVCTNNLIICTRMFLKWDSVFWTPREDDELESPAPNHAPSIPIMSFRCRGGKVRCVCETACEELIHHLA